MRAQREQWKKKIEKARKETYNLPFIKSELDKCPFKFETLTQKYRDICIDIHTRSFINKNGMSEAVGLDINNADHFHDCTMISKNRIDHAILTGLSFVLVHKKTNQVLHMCIYYDEFDLPLPINASEFRSKAIKLRNSLLNHFEYNDNWIYQMKHNGSSNINVGGFGKIFYVAYGARNSNIDKSLVLPSSMVHLMRQIAALCFYGVGYRYHYGIQAHPSTVLYVLAMDNIVNDNNNYKNVNYNCQGYVKVTSLWNFSKYGAFVEHVNENNSNINCNARKMVINDKLCWLSCFINDFDIIRNNGWSLEEYWNWTMYEILKQLGEEFGRLKQNFKKEMQTQKMIQKKQKHTNMVSKL